MPLSKNSVSLRFNSFATNITYDSLHCHCTTSCLKGLQSLIIGLNSLTIMWYYYLAAGLITFWWFLLRPRGGGKDSPPLVTASTVVRVPLFGVIAEFLSNPNEMICLHMKHEDMGVTLQNEIRSVITDVKSFAFQKHDLFLPSLLSFW